MSQNGQTNFKNLAAFAIIQIRNIFGKRRSSPLAERMSLWTWSPQFSHHLNFHFEKNNQLVKGQTHFNTAFTLYPSPRPSFSFRFVSDVSICQSPRVVCLLIYNKVFQNSERCIWKGLHGFSLPLCYINFSKSVILEITEEDTFNMIKHPFRKSAQL